MAAENGNTRMTLPSLTVTSSVTGFPSGVPPYCQSDRFQDFHQCSYFKPAQEFCQSKCPRPGHGRGNAWPDCHDDPLCEILETLRILEREDREFLESAW